MIKDNVQNQILKEIQQYDTIMIHRHQRPDPDALGSQVGLAEILRATYPKKNIYVVGGPVEGLEYLSEMDEVADNLYEGALVIVTDTANAPRISDDRYKQGEKLIKIDHHPKHEPYGTWIWVNTSASSCSEMIADFYHAFPDHLVMTDNAARLLYGGIVGDTGRFMHPSTSAHTFSIVSHLRTYSFDAALLNRQISEISATIAKLSGYVYEHLSIDENGAGMIVLPTEILNEYQVVDSETSSLVSLAGQIDSVISWALFIEQPEGYYRVRIRSKGPVINDIAKRHHGGGHPLASGANAYSKQEVQEIYQEIQEKVLSFGSK